MFTFNHHIEHTSQYLNTAMMGSTITSGIIILDYVKDIVPVFYYVGVTCGSILALHGVIELIMHYIRKFKNGRK